MKKLPKRVKLTIIIVNYNTSFYLKRCLQSIVDSKKLPFIQKIVIDNGSCDDSVGMVAKNFPDIELIINKNNLGYAKANNQGIKKALGEYILLLNSDTKLKKNTLQVMIKFLDQNKDVGVATCNVILESGTIDTACHRGFPTPWAALTYFLGLERLFPKIRLFSGYHQWYKNLSEIHEIDSPSGAFYLLRRNVIDCTGLLDEDFFMYGEDLDWSYRIKQNGFKIFFNPYTSIIHFKKRSGRAQVDKKIRQQSNYYFYQTMKLFYKKHIQKRYPAFFSRIIFILIDFKILFNRLF